jgi:hypothetical protein
MRTNTPRHSEAAFKTIIEEHFLQQGVRVR